MVVGLTKVSYTQLFALLETTTTQNSLRYFANDFISQYKFLGNRLSKNNQNHSLML